MHLPLIVVILAVAPIMRTLALLRGTTLPDVADLVSPRAGPARLPPQYNLRIILRQLRNHPPIPLPLRLIHLGLPLTASASLVFLGPTAKSNLSPTLLPLVHRRGCA
jgi:hypothetical protein